jgi:threonine dehydratase
VLSRSLLSGHRYQVAAPGSEGVFVSRIGPEVFRLCDTLVDDVILVSDDEICSAIRDVFVDTRAVLEPAGATSIAGAKKYYAQHGAPDGTSCVAVASDAAHIEFDLYRCRERNPRAARARARCAHRRTCVPAVGEQLAAREQPHRYDVHPLLTVGRPAVKVRGAPQKSAAGCGSM